MTNDVKIKLAVIGVGRMGGRHANNILAGRVKNAVLTAVCDTDEKALGKFRGKAAVYSDYKELIDTEKLDAVIVATPHYSHGEIAVYAINHGVSTLVEKPLTVTAKEAKKVIAAANAHPSVTAAVMLNQRTNPLYARAKKLVDDGEIGEIRRVDFIVTDWYRSQAYYKQGGWRASYSGEGGGTLINQCVHQLDILQWITGMPSEVTAYLNTRDRNITTENEVTAVFGYANGARCTFTASAAELHGTNRLEIAGDKGRIVIDKYKMKVIKFLKSETQVNSDTKIGYGSVTLKYTKKYDSTAVTVRELLAGQQLNILRNFAAAVRGEEHLLSPIADGLNSVEMINAAYMSGWQNEKTYIPVDDEIYEKLLNYKRGGEKENN